MCYFRDVPRNKRRVLRVPKSKPIKAWKVFYRSAEGTIHSPYKEATWEQGAPSQADGVPNIGGMTGFYAFAGRKAAEEYVEFRSEFVCRVLLWGKVVEHKRHTYEFGPNYLGPSCKGYRAEWCMIP
jgi:hypothetical protein